MCFSALPYQFQLGSSDDWHTMAVLEQVKGTSSVRMMKALVASDPHMNVRPVQTSWLLLGFDAFGLHPTPYHIFNTVVVGIMIVTLYVTVRELLAAEHVFARSIAVTVAAAFGSSPQYSTDKLWVSSQQATFCITFALFAVFALQRWAESEDQREYSGSWPQ